MNDKEEGPRMAQRVRGPRKHDAVDEVDAGDEEQDLAVVDLLSTATVA